MSINKPILDIASAQTREKIKILVIKVTGWNPLTEEYRYFRPPNPITVQQTITPDPAFCNEGYYPYVFAEDTEGDGDGFALNISVDATGVLSWEIYSSGSNGYSAGDFILFPQSQLEQEGIIDADENAESFFFQGPATQSPVSTYSWGVSADLNNSFKWFRGDPAGDWLDTIPIGTTLQFTTESGYFHRGVTTSLATEISGSNSRYISFANDPWPQEILDAFDNNEGLTVSDPGPGGLGFNVVNVEPPQVETQAPERVGQIVLFKESPSDTGIMYVAVEVGSVLQWKPVRAGFTAYDLRTGEPWDPLANFYSPLVPYQK